MKRTWRRPTVQAWIDFLSILVAVSIGYLTPLGAQPDSRIDWRRIAIGGCYILLWNAQLHLVGVRRAPLLPDPLEQFRKLLHASFLTYLGVAALAYALGLVRARSYTILVGLLGLALLLLTRLASRLWSRLTSVQSPGASGVLLVGDQSWCEQIADIARSAESQLVVAGTCSMTEHQMPLPATVAELARMHNVAGVAVSLTPSLGHSWLKEVSWLLEGTGVPILVDTSVTGLERKRIALQSLQRFSFLQLSAVTHDSPLLALKRLVDIVGSLVALAVLGVPMLVIALLIRLDSPGRALFRQTRMGQNNEPFTCLKFRTMQANAELMRDSLWSEVDDESPQFKIQNDPRITQIGSALRRFSLDELPQLLNVLGGSMSLVGPRPQPMDEAARYSVRDARRLLAKPGMTGLWQVSGRSDLDWAERVRLDLLYVEKWSMSLDFILLVRTVKVVLRSDGAY